MIARSLVQAGADIFRLNCSHRRGGDFERVYPLIRQSAKELGKKAGDEGIDNGEKWIGGLEDLVE